MGDGAIGRFLHTTAEIQLAGAVGQTDGTTAARLAPAFLRPGIEVEAGGAEPLLAAGPVAVQVETFTEPLRQAVVGDGFDGRMAGEQIRFDTLEGGEQIEDVGEGTDRLLQGSQRRFRQGREGGHIVGIAEGARITGAGEGPLQTRGREIGGAGHADQTVTIPDADGDGAALRPFQLLGTAPIHLHGEVGAAGRAEIPAVDTGPLGQLMELFTEGAGIEDRRRRGCSVLDGVRSDRVGCGGVGGHLSAPRP